MSPRTRRIGRAVPLLLAACIEPDAADRDEALESLVESERAFAAAAAELGTRDAFLAFLAKDAILFRPQAVNGTEWLEQQPERSGALAWEPAAAEVSDAGDLGYTTGPWSFAPDTAAPPVAFGQYFTIWKRGSDGSWRVVIDHGATHSSPVEPPYEVSTPPGRGDDRRRSAGNVDESVERESLLERDRSFASTTETRGSLQAINDFLAEDVILLRNDTLPLRGIGAARQLAVDLPGTLTWEVGGGGVSRSGDLGYTYGEYIVDSGDSKSDRETGVYLRAWRRRSSTGGAWRVAVELLTPLPAS